MSLGIHHDFFNYTDRLHCLLSWRPIVPLGEYCYTYNAMFNLPAGTTTCIGVPHFIDEDTSYNGYFIPAGSVILANLW